MKYKIGDTGILTQVNGKLVPSYEGCKFEVVSISGNFFDIRLDNGQMLCSTLRNSRKTKSEPVKFKDMI